MFWVYANNTARLKPSHQDIVDRLKLPRRKDPRVDTMQLVFKWLCNGQSEKWLLVLNSADDNEVLCTVDKDGSSSVQKALYTFFPYARNGTILVTSRDEVTAVNFVGIQSSIVRVGPMNAEDALALLKKTGV